MSTPSRNQQEKLLKAIHRGRIELAIQAVKEGAILDEELIGQALIEFDDTEVLRLASASSPEHLSLLAPLESRRYDVLRAFIQMGADVNKVGSDQETVLLHCASMGDRVGFDLLVEHGARLDVQNNLNRTVFYEAIGSGDPGLVERLVELGGRVDKPCDEDSYFPLHVAASFSDARLCRLLVQLGADVNQKAGSLRETALHAAAGVRDPKSADVVDVLVKAGADPNVLDKDGWTPLHTCAAFGCAQTARVLIEHGARVDLLNNYERTSLMEACRHGQTDVVAVFLEVGAKIEDVTRAMELSKTDQVANLLDAYLESNLLDSSTPEAESASKRPRF